jgi:hypothetical protein
MQLKGFFKDSSSIIKFMLLIGIAIACISVLTFIGAIIIKPLLGINVLTEPNVLSNIENTTVVNALKIMQLCNALGLFIIPPFLFKYLSCPQNNSLIPINNRPSLLQMLLAGVAIIAALPLINLLASINSHLQLPHFLKSIEDWMKLSEKNAAVITQKFLEVNTIGGLLFNLLLIAIIPGFGEELLFRGTLQPLFVEQTKSKIAGIILAAIVFSALHLQFYGFLPRMAIGVFFGFLLVWTNSLWVPMFAHFVNNGVAVLASYFLHSNNGLEELGTQGTDWYLILLSLVIVSAISFWFYKNKININPS